jgi:hypothetical protein
MRERITYILRDQQSGLDPSDLTVTDSSITLPGIDAAKEHQITLSFSELPQEVILVKAFKTSRLELI